MNHTSYIKQENVSLSDRLSYGLATGMGAGFVPFAPGTVGAIEGVAIYLAFEGLYPETMSFLVPLVFVNVILFGIGVWASSRTCKLTGLDDARLIVIDEVSGQLIALTPLALLPSLSILGLIIGFALFRLFDILKPYPIRRLEKLHGGFGVMADDALAGVYAAVLLWLSYLVGVV